MDIRTARFIPLNTKNWWKVGKITSNLPVAIKATLLWCQQIELLNVFQVDDQKGIH